MKFLDEAKVTIQSGSGGKGCVSFRRERSVPYGGPNGGNGGHGGDVLAKCTPHLNTLIDYRYHRHYKGGSGKQGGGQDKAGARGQDCTLLLPPGTQIFEEDGETLLADFTQEGQTALLLKGGHGGFGNAMFKSSTNQAPRHANPGEEGEEKTIILSLKSIAHVGLIGLPNAGKSTLLNAVSHANSPADAYPFTTRHPHLGMVELEMSRSFVMADIPGLIEGAHKGRGLGDRFLKHVERCFCLLHLIDATLEDVVETYQKIHAELLAYESGDLSSKPCLIVLTKLDMLDAALLDEKRASLARIAPYPIYAISSYSKQGLRELLEKTFNIVEQEKNLEQHKNDSPLWSPAL